MDPQFGDDLLGGFSGPSDQEESASEGEDKGESLDLLSAMLESSTRSKPKKPKKKKVQRKVLSSPVVPKHSTEHNDAMLEMKAKMEAMQAELNLLRQQVTSQSSPRQQLPETHKTSGAPSNNSLAAKSVSGGRVAHQPSSAKPLADSTRPPLDRDVSSKLISQRKADQLQGVLTEKYSGLRIKNPLVSSEVMSQRMAGRKMVRIPRLPSSTKGGDIEGDWVTIGVIVDKLPPKESKKGDKFCVWKLSDLSGQTAVVTVFLFKGAYQEHWKTPLGHVVALLNPNVMPSREQGQTDSGGLALSLDHPKRLMMMGVSQDYTHCKATTKSGKKCTNFANTSHGGYCDYHTSHAYSRSRAHRMECQSGYGPDGRSLREKLFKNSKTDVFFAEGRTFVASGRGTSKSEKGRLFVPGAREAAAHTMHELQEQRGGVISKRGVVTQEGSEIFKQMLQNQTIGARMLTKHKQKTEAVKKEAEGDRLVEKSALQLLSEEHQARVCTGPVLGRGCGPGGVVDLGISQAKRKAIAKMRGSDDSWKSSILRKVEENRELEQDGDVPQTKKPRMSTEEVDKIINAKSSHDWINKEVELDREEEYFDRLEKKENLDEKLQSIKELQVSVVQCRECGYVAEHASELCRKESHSLSKFKTIKKCFQCKSCHERQFVYTGRPVVGACARCGGTSHVQASLYKERRGPTLPTEQLKLRGDEEKFLNSLH